MIVEILTIRRFAHARFITARGTTKKVDLSFGCLMTPFSAHEFYNVLLNWNTVEIICEAHGVFEDIASELVWRERGKERKKKKTCGL